MDPRLLRYYNQELQYIREMGGEFAKEFPKIADRLGLKGFECKDPYVERLLEGFAFLAARVQLRIDAEFPRLTQHLLEVVYPHFLAPTPSMVVAQFVPDLNEGSLADGFCIPRLSVLRSPLGKGEQTACRFRTAHEMTLWPLELAEAEYVTHPRNLPASVLSKDKIGAGLRLRLRTTAGLKFNELALESLPLFLQGVGEFPMHLYEQLLSNAVGVIVQPVESGGAEPDWHTEGQLRSLGLEDEQALLPYGHRSFQGYRLLHEYFVFPERFMFAELTGLGQAVKRCQGSELDVTVLFDRSDPRLHNAVDTSHLALFCTPAINLFPKAADRIHLEGRESEYHVIPDRTRPLDFEIYEISDVVGHGTNAEERQEFSPFYGCTDLSPASEQGAYYTIRRVPSTLSSKRRQREYFGTEVFLSLVDAEEAPHSTSLRQLALNTLCTNRDLPLQMSVRSGKTDLTLESSGPVNAIWCLAGPSRPRPSHADGETAWRLISHLSLNYLSLADAGDQKSAAALRELLKLYGDFADAAVAKQIEGLIGVTAEPVTRPLPGPGPMSFGRGLHVTLTFNERAFEGTGVFLLGAVLEQFIRRYVSINSFTETILRGDDRGEIKRWPIRSGRRPRL